MTDDTARSSRVAILTPTGRDGMLAERALARWGVDATAFRDMSSLVAAVRENVGALLLAVEALVDSSRTELVAELERQPPWSDIPVVILTTRGEIPRAVAASIEPLAARSSVTLLERPLSVATLVTTIRSALRARDRQYEVRDNLRSLSEARVEAEAANRAKLEFLAMMSHELRTPLNAIGGYVQLLELGIRGPITTEQREDLDRIQRSQRHLLGLINGVLNYARIERGNLEYELTNVELREVIATAETLVTPQARARSLTLEVAECQDPLIAVADREKVQQIVLNLLTNAIKFTEAGGRVSVSCAATEDQIVLDVEDTGRGVPAAKIDTIFEPFIQVDSRLTRTQEGVGLGLSISRELARGMGGDLNVKSVPGVGSTFTLTLPRAPR